MSSPKNEKQPHGIASVKLLVFACKNIGGASQRRSYLKTPFRAVFCKILLIEEIAE
jgi:hypothetical protein